MYVVPLQKKGLQHVLLRRPALATNRNQAGAAHVQRYLEHNRRPLELMVLLLHVEQYVLRIPAIILTKSAVQRRQRLRSRSAHWRICFVGRLNLSKSSVL